MEIMASGPITSWKIYGKHWKQWQTLFSWAPKSLQMVTAAMILQHPCSLEEKQSKLSVLKNKDITLPAKVHTVKAIAFPLVIHWCESWTIKKGECQRIDAFELWCWRRFLREDSWESFVEQGAWTSKSYSKSTLNTHWKDWCWSWNSNTFATWCQGLFDWKRPWCW